MGISTHILDTALGRPAASVPVTLSHQTEAGWSILCRATTNLDGRVQSLLPTAPEPGLYLIHFDTGAYFAQNQLTCLYPYIEVVFEVRDAHQHYHIPLLLTANGYTTYRGS